MLMDREFTGTGPLFRKSNRLKADYRALLQQTVFADFKLSVDKIQSQKRLVLDSGTGKLPFMAWSAGQREFVPLLLGLYWLMPPSKVARRGTYAGSSSKNWRWACTRVQSRPSC